MKIGLEESHCESASLKSSGQASPPERKCREKKEGLKQRLMGRGLYLEVRKKSPVDLTRKDQKNG